MAGRSGTATPSTGKKPERDQRGRFTVGNKSGGRKRIPEDVKEMLRAATVDAARLLIDTMQNKDAKLELRLECCKTIMDRVYGKASQPIEGGMENVVQVVLGELEDYAD